MFQYAAVLATLAVAAYAVDVPASGSVSVQSPNYPAVYPNSYGPEETLFEGPEGSSLQFDASFFDLENACSYDYVEIRDSDGSSLGKFCGTSGPVDVRTSGNTATLVFRTDSSVNGGGYVINAKVAKCPKGVGSCPNHPDVCLASNQWCNKNQDCPDNSDETNCMEPGNCGKSSVQPILNKQGHKIVGGVPSLPNAWPWQIAFLVGGRQICGGSLIASQWVLTAAHCCEGQSVSRTQVRVGAHNLNSGSEGAQNINVVKIINHKSYTSRPATDNDVCLMKLATPVVFGRNTAPVCLPDIDDALEAKNTTCYITGWGTTGSGGSSSSTLLQTSVQLSDHQYCNTAYGGVISNTMICAAAPGRDTCQGDSGGPLVCFHNEGVDENGNQQGSYRQIGVTSWGRGCASPGYPGVYARTSKFVSWIAETIGMNS